MPFSKPVKGKNLMQNLYNYLTILLRRCLAPKHEIFLIKGPAADRTFLVEA